jgi:hypothetical protein
MSSLLSQLNRVKALQSKLYPKPKRERWLPQGVYVREIDGEYYYDDIESEETDRRCEKLGIVPNVYVVTDDFHPDMDGCEGREEL